MPRTRNSREAIVKSATRLYADHPTGHFTMQALARSCNVTLWALRYNFSSADELFREAAGGLVAELAARCAHRGDPVDQVHLALTREAEATAGMLESPAYRDLLLMMLRNGREHAWLEQAYEQEIVRRVCARIETAVIDSSRLGGSAVVLGEGAARRLFKRLETAFALAALLPAGAEPFAPDREHLLREAVREAFDATYLFDWSVPAAA